MSYGGMLLETKKICEHSPRLRRQGPVSAEVVRKYVGWWKHTGFLGETQREKAQDARCVPIHLLKVDETVT